MNIKSYPKSELAMLYFPDASTPHIAQNHLNAWIKRCKPLKKKLDSCHQSPYAKYYSASQVRLITEYLGDP